MIDLPPSDDPVGLTARLLIAESLTPGAAAYDEGVVRRGMIEMRATLSNRLTSPRDFCAAGAQDEIGIITAVCPGGGHQFAGFSLDGGQVSIDAPVARRIQDCVDRANSGSDDYARFVQAAVDVANSSYPSAFADLTDIGGIAVKSGPFGWRTAGHGSPGGRFVAIPISLGGVIAGNQFFTLKA